MNDDLFDSYDDDDDDDFEDSDEWEVLDEVRRLEIEADKALRQRPSLDSFDFGDLDGVE